MSHFIIITERIETPKDARLETQDLKHRIQHSRAETKDPEHRTNLDEKARIKNPDPGNEICDKG